MANLSVRRVDEALVHRLKEQARRESVSMEEKVRRILAEALPDDEPIGTKFRRLFANPNVSNEEHFVLPPPEYDEPIDFSGPEYGDDEGR